MRLYSVDGGEVASELSLTYITRINNDTQQEETMKLVSCGGQNLCPESLDYTLIGNFYESTTRHLSINVGECNETLLNELSNGTRVCSFDRIRLNVIIGEGDSQKSYNFVSG